jgi:hypothetical protein
MGPFVLTVGASLNCCIAETHKKLVVWTILAVVFWFSTSCLSWTWSIVTHDSGIVVHILFWVLLTSVFRVLFKHFYLRNYSLKKLKNFNFQYNNTQIFIKFYQFLCLKNVLETLVKIFLLSNLKIDIETSWLYDVYELKVMPK